MAKYRKNTGAAQAAPEPDNLVHKIVGLQAEVLGGPAAEDAPEIVSSEELEASGCDSNGERVIFKFVACRLADGRRVIDSEEVDKLTIFIANGGNMLVTEQDRITRFMNGLDLGNAGVGSGKVLTL